MTASTPPPTVKTVLLAIMTDITRIAHGYKWSSPFDKIGSSDSNRWHLVKVSCPRDCVCKYCIINIGFLMLIKHILLLLISVPVDLVTRGSINCTDLHGVCHSPSPHGSILVEAPKTPRRLYLSFFNT